MSDSGVKGDDLSLNDEPLARLLSKLASLQGHAVPAHRFGMAERTDDGVELTQLPRDQRATELWTARFPSGPVQRVLVNELKREHFPLLWVSADAQQVVLVRGRLSSGALSAENDQNQTIEIAPAIVEQGILLSMRTNEDSASAESHGDRSATEWFAFAIRKHRRVFLDAVFATFMLSALGLISSLYTMQVYDRVVPTQGFSTLWVLTVGVMIAIVLEFVMKQLRAYMVDRASKVIDQELSAVFFGKALDIRMDVRPKTVGTFASQIRHFESVRQFMTSSTLFILTDAPFALLFIGVIAMLAGYVALVPFVMVFAAVATGVMFRAPIERLTAKTMAESNRKNGLLIEAVDGIESIKAAGGEWKMLDRYNALNITIGVGELELRELTNRAANLTQTIQQISYVGMIAAGAYAITNGSLTTGGLMACSIISGRALGPIAQIPQLIVQWKHAQIALASLDGIMAMPSDRDANERLIVPEQCAGLLQLKQISFAYGQDKPILEVAECVIRPGERVGVIGSVGSGKSTLIKLLSGLYKPTTGSLFLDGVDVSHIAPEFVREHVGYLPQDVRLFSGSLRDNLTLGLPAPSDSQILAAAKLTGLDLIIQNHPRGLELQITEAGRGLSGGQRQLVGLTRMLLARPKIMLLDEPTASMDGALEARVMQHLVNDVDRESVLAVVTHKMSLLSLMTRIIVVDRGRILMDGPRDEVLIRLQQLQQQQVAQAAVNSQATS
jgi:ATP-binding cassette subfamily C protein LapB